MFKVLYSYIGWSNVNYVLNNVKDPVRTLKIAGPLGLCICGRSTCSPTSRTLRRSLRKFKHARDLRDALGSRLRRRSSIPV